MYVRIFFFCNTFVNNIDNERELYEVSREYREKLTKIPVYQSINRDLEKIEMDDDLPENKESRKRL